MCEKSTRLGGFKAAGCLELTLGAPFASRKPKRILWPWADKTMVPPIVPPGTIK